MPTELLTALEKGPEHSNTISMNCYSAWLMSAFFWVLVAVSSLEDRGGQKRLGHLGEERRGLDAHGVPREGRWLPSRKHILASDDGHREGLSS